MFRWNLLDVFQIVGRVRDFISVGTNIQGKIEIVFSVKNFGSGSLVQLLKSFGYFVWADDIEANGGECWEEKEDFVADDVAVGVVQVVFLFVERQREDADIVDLRKAFGCVLVMVPTIK